jgi:hypothetical protein
MSSSLSPAAKVVILTSEAGSVTLRTEGEGGGMYGHHGSKGNMIGHLLGYDLKERGVPIAMIHVRLDSPFFLVNSSSPTLPSLPFTLALYENCTQSPIPRADHIAWFLED